MTVKELSQLYWLNREIEADKRRLEELDIEIKRDEEQLARIETKATSASGTKYDGMPKAPSYGNRLESTVVELVAMQDAISRKKALRSDCAMAIQAKQILCLTERNRLERYISNLPDSLLRMVFTYRFVNGMTWAQVSEAVGMKTTEDSVKKLCYRFLAGEKGRSE